MSECVATSASLLDALEPQLPLDAGGAVGGAPSGMVVRARTRDAPCRPLQAIPSHSAPPTRLLQRAAHQAFGVVARPLGWAEQAAPHDLVSRPVPFDYGAVTHSLVWYGPAGEEPARRWFRQRILQLARALA